MRKLANKCRLWACNHRTHICMHLSILLSGYSVCYIKNTLKQLSKTVSISVVLCLNGEIIKWILKDLKSYVSLSQTEVPIESIYVNIRGPVICWILSNVGHYSEISRQLEEYTLYNLAESEAKQTLFLKHNAQVLRCIRHEYLPERNVMCIYCLSERLHLREFRRI